MSRLGVTLLSALLAGCAASPEQEARQGELEQEIQELQTRLLKLNARLLKSRAEATSTVAAVATPAATPLASALVFLPEEMRELQAAALSLADLPPELAGEVILSNWQGALGRKRSIKILSLMKRQAADAILAGLKTKPVIWVTEAGVKPARLRVLDPGHAKADENGYVLLRTVERR